VRHGYAFSADQPRENQMLGHHCILALRFNLVVPGPRVIARWQPLARARNFVTSKTSAAANWIVRCVILHHTDRNESFRLQMLIAHLSDPHLCPPGHLYQKTVNSNEMFVAAIRQLAKLEPPPDLVLLTGDIVDTGTEAEYAVAAEMIAQIPQPVLVIPGNHDDRERFRVCFGHNAYIASAGPLHFAVGDQGPLRILGLDITVPGAHHGDMDAAACLWLRERLAEEPDRPTIIIMHQPPFDSGIPFIDKYCCRHGTRIAEIVAGYPAIERILCGHIHRFMQLRFGGTMLVTAPSTTTAIALRLQENAEPASFLEPPAMLLHHWRPQLGLITHLVPIGSFLGPLAFF
jgi:Icc-related predicted phosphoesterase